MTDWPVCRGGPCDGRAFQGVRVLTFREASRTGEFVEYDSVTLYVLDLDETGPYFRFLGPDGLTESEWDRKYRTSA